MARYLAITNRKGGSGKTTTAVNLAAALSHRGKRVMLVDADPQSHATISLGHKASRDGTGLYNVLSQGVAVEQNWAKTYSEKLVLLPGSASLHKYQRAQELDTGILGTLKQSLLPMSDRFDFIVFDTPPTMGLLTLSVLVACTEVYVPLQTHYLALEGLAEVVTVIRKVSNKINPSLQIRGVIPTFFRGNTNLAKGVIAEIRKSLGNVVLHPIRQCIALAEAPGFGQCIFQYSPRSNGGADYFALSGQIDSGYSQSR